MRNLIAKSGLHGQPPLTLAGVTLSEATLGRITSLAAYPGRAAALADRLNGLPPPGRLLSEPLRVWTGPDQWFLIGTEAPPDLTDLAAQTDQSSGWAALTLTGTKAAEALMRLYPLDLRPTAFPPGHAARAPIGHMQSVLLCTAPDTFTVLVFRSMARTAWAEIAEVLHHLEARETATS